MDTKTFSLEEALLLVSERKYSLLRSLITDSEPADIAELFNGLTPEQIPVIFRLLPKELAAEVFVELDFDLQKLLINAFSDTELRAVLDELFDDDTVDIIDEMPANVVKRILANSSPETRRTINELLKYPEDSAGSIMTTEYVRLRDSLTVDEAFAHIRRVAIDKETVYVCYVTDDSNHLTGFVTALSLMLSGRDARIADIMEHNVISAKTLDDKEYVANIISKYDFLALPIVDAEKRLVGIVTVDDAIDVMHEKAEEDFAKMAAITPNEKPYLRTSVLEIWKTRIPWLFLLMISATFTGMIISSFENALAAQVVLTAFIPMLMDTGGNAGSQASVTIIRGLSLGEIRFRDILPVIWKELRVAVMCGLSLAAATFVKILLVDKLIMGQEITLLIALVICLTLCVTVLCAKLIGCTLPLIAQKAGFDPAVMASPFITTIVDAVSLVVYFRLATLLLGL